MSYIETDTDFEGRNFSVTSPVTEVTGTYRPSLYPRLSVPTSTVVQFLPMYISPTGSGVDRTVSETWTIPTCKADTGDGLTRNVSYTGQTSTRGKSVSFHTGGSKDSYAFENSNMREGLYSPEYHQTGAGGETASRFWEQDFRNLVIDRNHNTSLSEGSNFDMVTQSQVNGPERLPERLSSTRGIFVNPSSPLYSNRNETSSSSYMPHTASRLTDTLNIRIPGSQTTPGTYPVSNNLVTCQTSVNAGSNMLYNSLSRSSTIQPNMVASTCSFIEATVPSCSRDSNFNDTYVHALGPSVVRNATPWAVGPMQSYNNSAYVPGPSVTTAVSSVGPRCSLMPETNLYPPNLQGVGNNAFYNGANTYAHEQPRQLGFENLTGQNCVRMPHTGYNQSAYMYNEYQMPYATAETGSYSFPRPEFNNNVPFHPVPSSIVGPC